MVKIIKVEVPLGAGAATLERCINELFTEPKREAANPNERVRHRMSEPESPTPNALGTRISKPRKPRSRPPDGLRSRQEAAAMLGCSVRTLDAHIASGALRYVNVGRGSRRERKMFAESDLNIFIQSRTREEQCPSTGMRVRRTGSSTSSGEVIAFTARPSAPHGAKPKP